MQLLHRIAPSLFPDVLEVAPTMWLQSKVDSIIDARIAPSETMKRNDLLQLLLDAATTKPIGENELHMDEVKLNVFLFMAAGFDTTSTALAYSTYILATKPDIQKKLQAEIDEHQEKEIDYDLVAKMFYMDLFIQEVLRSVIQPDILSIHYNSDLWGPDDPNQFVPERHNTERHPVALLAFGVGS
ncbi:unnamed protein product, partial [Rotaria sordida]